MYSSLKFQFLIGRLITKVEHDHRGQIEQFQFLIGRLITKIAPVVFLPGKKFQFLIGRLITQSREEAIATK